MVDDGGAAFKPLLTSNITAGVDKIVSNDKLESLELLNMSSSLTTNTR
jgi:hypothetical protein